MILRGDLVHCPRLGEVEILHDHLLGELPQVSSLFRYSPYRLAVVNSLGFIDYVGAANLRRSKDILKNASEPLIVLDIGTFVLPTFCDLHLHAPQFLYQGTGLHLPLMEWLNEYAFKAEESLDADPALAERVYTRLTERLIENGTGAVLLFGTIKVDTK